MKGVAFDYLREHEPLKLAQLQHCRPELNLGVPQCQRCHNGQVVRGECLQCGAEHTKDGELIGSQTAAEIRALYGNEGHRNKVYIP